MLAAAGILPVPTSWKEAITPKKLFAAAAGSLFSKSAQVNTGAPHFRKEKMLKNKYKPVLIGILVLAVVTPLVLFQYYQSQLAPLSKDETPIRVVINPGQPLKQIAAKLQEEKLIRNAIAFRILVTQMGITTKIQAGDYRLKPNLSSQEIAQTLTHGALDIWITFTEGKRIEEQAQIVEEKLNDSTNDNYQFNKEEYIKIAKEGFMFPDTYLISKDATAQDVAEKLRGTFDEKVGKALLAKGAKNNLIENQVVILASLIERESRTIEEKAIISGILHNRLKLGMALQVDATVQYGKGYDIAKKSWWPPVFTNDYKSVKSSYNTYLINGLPPAPISNPGLESIRAAAEPADTDYLYYLHDAEGKIHYAKTAEEHSQNIQKYL